jgi:transposase-like protein
MSFMNADESVLQIDERGHVRVSKERRAALLEEFERSGMSGAKFARLAGIKYPTFMYWLKQRRERGRDEGEGRLSETPAVSFVEAVIGGTSRKASAEGLTIELAGGACLRVESPIQLQLAAELLRMLAPAGMR